MGVTGLISWLKDNKNNLGEKYKLSNQSLVIDASNFYATIFMKFCLEGEFYRNDNLGGDLIRYSERVRNLVAKLKLCRIKPRFILHGSIIHSLESAKDELKFREINEKEYNRIYLIKRMQDWNSEGDFMMNELSKEIFKQIMFELDVDCEQAPFESEEYSVDLANELDCPVLSYDSEFMIYKLNKGMIITDLDELMNPRLDSITGEYYIETYLFSQSKLLKYFPSLDLRCLTLLGILVGGDYNNRNMHRYTDIKTFSDFEQSYKEDLIMKSRSNRYIVSCLVWFEKNSYEKSVEIIYEKLAQVVEPVLINNYEVLKRTNLRKELELVLVEKRPSTVDVNIAMKAVDNVVNMYCKYKAPTVLLDILFEALMYTLPITDDLKQKSASIMKYRAIGVAISLLKKIPSKDDDNSQSNSLYMFDRDCSEIKLKIVKEVNELENFGSLKSITVYNSFDLSVKERQSILLDTFKIKSVKQLNSLTNKFNRLFKSIEQSQMFALVYLLIDYVFKEDDDCQIDDNFKLALLITMFYYAHSRGELNEANVNMVSAWTFKEKVSQYEKMYDKNDPIVVPQIMEYNLPVNDYYMVMRSQAQMIFALEGYIIINSLLGQIYPKMRPQIFYNGVLIVRLTRMLKNNMLITRDMVSDEVPTLFALYNEILLDY